MIKVGILGASPRAWAANSHIPALAALEQYELTAVATTNAASAQAAADAFGAPHWFVGAVDLARHPEVDLVVVSVRTAGHADGVRAALAAGKHVLVEWPLGVTADEATALAAEAAAAGVTHAVAAQVYHSAGARYVADLLAENRIGTVESVSYVGAGDPHGGSRVPPYLAWATAPEAANNLLTVMGGHALAAFDRAVGPAVGSLTEVSAVLSHLHDRVPVDGSAETATVDLSPSEATVANGVPGHLAFVGRFASGALGSVSIHGGNASAPDGFLLKITGTEGSLTVTPEAAGEYVNWARWRVRLAPADGAAHDLPIPDRYLNPAPGVGPGGPVENVVALYADLATAITDGRPATPDFHTAARIQRVLDAVAEADRTGTRQKAGEGR